MKLLFASDSFKGTLTSEQTIKLLAKAATEVFGKDISWEGVAVADGGMGCMRALGVRFLDENDNELEGLGKDAAQIFDYGIQSLMTTVDAPMPLKVRY